MNCTPTISAIIPTKNRPERVALLLANLRGQDYPAAGLEIIVIDDGSTPPCPASAAARLIRHEVSQGAQRSRNEGMAAASGEFILMLDDDVELVERDFLAQAAKVLREDTTVGAVFGRKFDVLHGGESVRTLEFSTSRARLTGELLPNEEPAGAITWGCQVYLARRELLLAAGGYDGIYGLNGGHSFREESDLQARLRKLGYQLWFLPAISFRHHVLPSGGHGPSAKRRLFWIAHNHIIFLRRHFSFWPLRALAFTAEMLRYSWVQGRFRHLGSMLAGYLAGWRNALRDRGPGNNAWLNF